MSVWKLAVVALVLWISPASFAAITICMLPAGPCITGLSGQCDENCRGTKLKCCRAVYSPATDYLLTINGQAWVVTGDQQTPFASDAFAALVSVMNAKYPVETRKDPKTQKLIDADYAAFFKNPDSGKVSMSRLKAFSRETGLKIVEKESAK